MDLDDLWAFTPLLTVGLGNLDAKFPTLESGPAPRDAHTAVWDPNRNAADRVRGRDGL